MIHQIDFAALYKAHLQRSERLAKTPSEWDAKAQAMRTQVLNSSYVQQFVARMALNANDTVLDVGCGPGTIALAIASQVQQVYGMDYSQGMLDAFQQNINEQQVANISLIHAAWEDDWSAIAQCDIAVVSRASIVTDMAAALNKLNQIARKRVYLTQLVTGLFNSREIAELLGREDRSFPDHIYIINLLYQQHIYPEVSYIELPSRLAGATSLAEFIDNVQQQFGPLNKQEKTKLTNWYQQNPSYAQQGGEPTRWAFLSWKPR